MSNHRFNADIHLNVDADINTTVYGPEGDSNGFAVLRLPGANGQVTIYTYDPVSARRLAAALFQAANDLQATQARAERERVA